MAVQSNLERGRCAQDSSTEGWQYRGCEAVVHRHGAGAHWQYGRSTSSTTQSRHKLVQTHHNTQWLAKRVINSFEAVRSVGVPCLADEVVTHDDNGHTGGAHVLLGACVDDAVPVQANTTGVTHDETHGTRQIRSVEGSA